MFNKFLKFSKKIFYFPILFLIYLGIKITPPRKITLIKEDLSRYNPNDSRFILKIYNLLLFWEKSYRNVFYERMPFARYFIKPFLQDNKTLHISTSLIKGGLLIVHGDATFIYAESIGKNLYINQCVTIGVIGNSRPTIGDNVRIGTGALVLGDVHIGNNATIGAGAVIVKNVPANATVVGNPARIIKLNGIKTNTPL